MSTVLWALAKLSSGTKRSFQNGSQKGHYVKFVQKLKERSNMYNLKTARLFSSLQVDKETTSVNDRFLFFGVSPRFIPTCYDLGFRSQHQVANSAGT